MIKDKIEKDKALKTYSLPSILVLDISRLGEAGRMPLGVRNVEELFTGASIPPAPSRRPLHVRLARLSCLLTTLTGLVNDPSHSAPTGR